MKKQSGYYFSFFCLLLLSTAVFSQNDRALFWKFSSDTATVYLLGSIHFADNSFYPLRKVITSAFDASDNLVVELDISSVDAGIYNRVLQEKGLYPAGDSLALHISDDTLRPLKKVLAELGVSFDQVKRQKPGILVLTLTALQAQKLGLDPVLGIDLYFIQRAKANKKIIELETLQQQLDLFISVPDGELLLKETIKSFDDADVYVKDLIEYWKTGDEDKMQVLLFEDTLNDYPAFTAIYERLFYQRNRQMSEKIQALLKRHEASFVVVGAGHLIGDRGIVRLLENSGYKAERL